jgi:hypothetical protein
VARREEIIVNDIARERRDPASQHLARLTNSAVMSAAYLPLTSRHRTIGVLTAQSTRLNAYSPHAVMVLRSVAAIAAAAIDSDDVPALVPPMCGTAPQSADSLSDVVRAAEVSTELSTELRHVLAAQKDKLHAADYRVAQGLLADVVSNLALIEEIASQVDRIARGAA